MGKMLEFDLCVIFLDRICILYWYVHRLMMLFLEQLIFLKLRDFLLVLGSKGWSKGQKIIIHCSDSDKDMKLFWV